MPAPLTLAQRYAIAEARSLANQDLMRAVFARDDAAMLRAIKAGATNLQSALDLVASHGAAPVMRALLQAGAKPTADALSRAISYGQLANVRVLVKEYHTPVKHAHVTSAALFQNDRILMLLLDHGGPVDFPHDTATAHRLIMALKRHPQRHHLLAKAMRGLVPG